MANTKSSKKTTIKSRKKNLENSKKRSTIRTIIKKVSSFIQSKDKQSAITEFKNMQSIIDRYTSKKILHKNKAARYKSKLEKKINKI